MRLPQWRDIEKKVNENKKCTELEMFLYKLEPGEIDDSKEFRKDFNKAIEEVINDRENKNVPG